jgi:hypothetical protein
MSSWTLTTEQIRNRIGYLINGQVQQTCVLTMSNVRIEGHRVNDGNFQFIADYKNSRGMIGEFLRDNNHSFQDKIKYCAITTSNYIAKILPKDDYVIKSFSTDDDKGHIQVLTWISRPDSKFFIWK